MENVEKFSTIFWHFWIFLESVLDFLGFLESSLDCLQVQGEAKSF
jgi:hypothetical protein